MKLIMLIGILNHCPQALVSPSLPGSHHWSPLPLSYWCESLCLLTLSQGHINELCLTQTDPMGPRVVPILWDIFGISLGYLWDIFGISLGHLWDIFGISLGYLLSERTSGVSPVIFFFFHIRSEFECSHWLFWEGSSWGKGGSLVFRTPTRGDQTYFTFHD